MEEKKTSKINIKLKNQKYIFIKYFKKFKKKKFLNKNKLLFKRPEIKYLIPFPSSIILSTSI